MFDVPWVPSPYRITRCLSRGRSARTYLAVDATTLQHVVIARTSHISVAPPDLIIAERCGRLLSRLIHPLVPRFLDSFEHENAGYLVTRFIEGEDLATLRRRGERFAEADVLAMLRDMAEVFEYLHHHLFPAIVHRDVRPGHVLWGADGRYHLLDFWGTARAEITGDEEVGTYGYIAPEVFEGRARSAADLYGLGATVLALTTDTEPEDLPHQGQRIDVRRALGGRLGEPLAALLQSLLELDPDRRPTRLLPLLDDLEHARAEGTRAVSVPSPGPEPLLERADPSSESPGFAWGLEAGGMLVTLVGFISVDRLPGFYAGADAGLTFYGKAIGWLYPACPVIIILVTAYAARALKRQAAGWPAWLSLAVHALLALLVFIYAPLAHRDSPARPFVLLTMLVACLASVGGRVLLYMALWAMGIVGSIWSLIQGVEALGRLVSL